MTVLMSWLEYVQIKDFKTFVSDTNKKSANELKTLISTLNAALNVLESGFRR